MIWLHSFESILIYFVVLFLQNHRPRSNGSNECPSPPNENLNDSNVAPPDSSVVKELRLDVLPEIELESVHVDSVPSASADVKTRSDSEDKLPSREHSKHISSTFNTDASCEEVHTQNKHLPKNSMFTQSTRQPDSDPVASPTFAEWHNAYEMGKVTFLCKSFKLSTADVFMLVSYVWNLFAVLHLSGRQKHAFLDGPGPRTRSERRAQRGCVTC